MKKINKNINIVLIFMIIGALLYVELACAMDTVLRVPISFDNQRLEDSFREIESSTISDLDYLSTRRPQTFANAKVLKEVLEDVQFDLLNKILRNDKKKLLEILSKPETITNVIPLDYFKEPFPIFELRENIQWLKNIYGQYFSETQNLFGINLRNLNAFLFLFLANLLAQGN